MSPRAACRLEALGFTQVYDYAPGKVDWLANNLPVDGEQAQAVTAGLVARNDAVTCRLEDRVGPLRERVKRSPYGFALVTTPGGVLLGRVRHSALSDDPQARAEDIMEAGPATVRAHVPASELAKRLAQREFETAIVTTPEGHLIGVARRTELESAGAEPHAERAEQHNQRTQER
jgi:Mg/Co/Ni transporter MgtE